MDQATYDTKDGIATMLDTYEHLYQLFRARREAGYARSERLNAFIVLGRFLADPHGNWYPIRFENLPPEAPASFSPVMTPDEFNSALKAFGEEACRYGAGSSTGPLGSLPPPHMTCSRCGKAGWTIENCHEFVSADGFEAPFSLAPFVGKTLTEVQEALNARTDAIYSLHPSVRNDRWIDPEGAFGREVGWRHNRDEEDEEDEDPIDMSYVVAEGDETNPFVLRFYHASCSSQMREEERAEQGTAALEAFAQIFTDTGFTNVRAEAIPLPEHILAWMRSEDPDGDLSGAADEMTYLRITSDQGVVGIFIAAYPTLDLTGSGVTLSELVPEMAAMPENAPQICGFDGNPATLLKLWQLLTQKKSAT